MYKVRVLVYYMKHESAMYMIGAFHHKFNDESTNQKL